MVDWMTVLISIGGSLFGGVGSALWQVNKSYEKEREERIDRELENWYHQVNSVCLRIRRETLRLPANEPVAMTGYRPTSDSDDVELGRLNKLVDNLMEVHTKAPAEVDRELLQKIEHVGYAYENLTPTMDHLTTTDIKSELQVMSEEIMEEVTRRADRYSSVPY